MQPNEIAHTRSALADNVIHGTPIGRVEWSYPRVDYASIDVLLSAAESVLASTGHPLEEIVSAELLSLRDCVETARVRRDLKTVRWSSERFGLPSDALQEDAANILDRPVADIGSELPEKSISAQEAKVAVSRVLDRNAFLGWTVVDQRQIVALMSVNSLHRRVSIRPDARFTEKQLVRLVVHEVGTHAFRARASQAQPEELASYGFGRSTATEEGLALWHEEDSGLLTGLDLRKYAARVLGVSLAMSHGIGEVARQLAQVVGPRLAVEIATRVKRGLIRPDCPGAMTKDFSYLEGFRQIGDHLSKSPGDEALLMSTKWPLSLIELARTMAEHGQLKVAGGVRLQVPSFADLFSER